jgi:hypothetical protein
VREVVSRSASLLDLNKNSGKDGKFWKRNEDKDIQLIIEKYLFFSKYQL